MGSPVVSTQLADGVTFNTVRDTRFKTNRISINLFTSMEKETVTVNALIPQLLRKGYRGCESFTMLNRKLEELYGAYVEADAYKKGDYQVLSLAITALDDRFALEGELITKLSAEILKNMLFDPIIENNGFSEKDVEIEKKALVDSIESELNEKRVYAINSMNRIMCGDEPYGLPRYGFVTEVASITPKSALAQYKELLKKSRIEIMFVGCGVDSEALGVLKNACTNIDRSTYKALAPIVPHTLSIPVKEKTENMQVAQSKLVIGFTGGVASKDELAPAMRMMVSVLGGTPSSKLFVNVREKLSLCYYCAARYDMSKGIMTIDSGVENENIEKAKTAIMQQLQDIKNGSFTDEEISFALLSLQNTYSSVYESDGSIEAFYLGQIIAGSQLSAEEERAKLEKVSRDDIIKAANEIKLDTVYLLTGKDVQ